MSTYIETLQFTQEERAVYIIPTLRRRGKAANTYQIENSRFSESNLRFSESMLDFSEKVSHFSEGRSHFVRRQVALFQKAALFRRQLALF